LQATNLKIGEWYFAFFKKFIISSVVLLGLISQSACMTIEKAEETADGQKIPGKRLFDFAEYEYICAPTHGKNHVELEQLFDRYGLKGWRLAGFMHNNGDTNAFCMYR